MSQIPDLEDDSKSVQSAEADIKSKKYILVKTNLYLHNHVFIKVAVPDLPAKPITPVESERKKLKKEDSTESAASTTSQVSVEEKKSVSNLKYNFYLRFSF